MSVQEILEEHLFVPGGFADPGNHCSCGNYYNNEYFPGNIQLDSHLSHVAEVLDKHIQEREAKAWDEGQDSVALHYDIFGASLEYEYNPYKEEK